MPLKATLDGPDSADRWPGFAQVWACGILSRLNLETLSERFRAGLSVHKYLFNFDPITAEPDRVVSATDAPSGFPPLPDVSVVGEFAEPQSIDVTVHDDELHRLVAAVCIAQPAFTRTAIGRRMFATKCLTYLQRGTAVVVVNAVSDAPADLHAELLTLCGRPDLCPPTPLELGVVVYRVAHVVNRGEQHFRLDVWQYPLAVGKVLPTVPVWLASDLAVPLDLELAYTDARASLRLA